MYMKFTIFLNVILYISEPQLEKICQFCNKSRLDREKQSFSAAFDQGILFMTAYIFALQSVHFIFTVVAQMNMFLRYAF